MSLRDRNNPYHFNDFLMWRQSAHSAEAEHRFHLELEMVDTPPGS